eukprot:TRINITY_DN7059_c0_g1_i14.p2 TRINITY_DN7059_c0_g1~~TRINITY_DN7059_c0_g1_i14.p2  ORF type:complete len:280 (+),score=-21.47 TRINITY_DN7059_c0_g1_i14:474-1313(+)
MHFIYLYIDSKTLLQRIKYCLHGNCIIMCMGVKVTEVFYGLFSFIELVISSQMIPKRIVYICVLFAFGWFLSQSINACICDCMCGQIFDQVNEESLQISWFLNSNSNNQYKQVNKKVYAHIQSMYLCRYNCCISKHVRILLQQSERLIGYKFGNKSIRIHTKVTSTLNMKYMQQYSEFIFVCILQDSFHIKVLVICCMYHLCIQEIQRCTVSQELVPMYNPYPRSRFYQKQPRFANCKQNYKLHTVLFCFLEKLSRKIQADQVLVSSLGIPGLNILQYF